MSKVKTKVVEAWEGGHTVEFWIDQQGFTLHIFLPELGMTSEEYAGWYKKQLDTAFERLIKTSFEAGWKMCDDHVDIGGGPHQLKEDYKNWIDENR